MGLGESSPVDLGERLNYDTSNNVLYVNFEGLSLETRDDARRPADFLDEKLSELGEVNVVINYDNFYLPQKARSIFFEMV